MEGFVKRFDSSDQSLGVVVSQEGERCIGVRLLQDFPELGVSAGDLMGVNVDGAIHDASLVVVAVDDSLSLAYARQWRGDFCFWFRGQRYPVRRASWGDKTAPVVVGTVFASGHVL